MDRSSARAHFDDPRADSYMPECPAIESAFSYDWPAVKPTGDVQFVKVRELGGTILFSAMLRDSDERHDLVPTLKQGWIPADIFWEGVRQCDSGKEVNLPQNWGTIRPLHGLAKMRLLADDGNPAVVIIDLQVLKAALAQKDQAR